MSEKREFSDISLSFEANPVTGDIVKVKDDISVKQSIKTLILTEYFEVPFQKSKGTKIRKILFELMDEESTELLRKEIIRIIQTYEPRANLMDVIIEPVPDGNKYLIKIIFSMINTLEPIQTEIFITRVR
tara:strand:+ start:244 stop:633 length:390 start_codon:yes stop_codon:yes gene_type:complete